MKIVQKGNYQGDILQTTLNNRDIENIELFLNPENAEETDPLDLIRSDIARSTLMKHITQKNTIVILVDADADGYTSAATLYMFIEDIDPDVDIHYIVHSQKAHGLTDEVMTEIASIGADLVLAPDAASNDLEQIKDLTSRGIDVVALDHHVVNEPSEHGVIVNNTVCPYTNDGLVGAGVVYKFIKGIEEEYGFGDADYYLDLVAVGQIGDSSDISDPEIRKLVLKGLSNIQNPFLKTAINNQLGLGKSLAPKDLSFTVIPLINAVTRVGTMEERELLFEAIAGIGSERSFNVKKKKKNKETGKFDTKEFVFNLYEYAHDIFTKVKNRQNAYVKKILPKIESDLVDDTGVIIAKAPELKYSGVTGLIANKLVGKYDKPSLLLNERDNSFTGSGRGHEKTMKDFRAWCESSNVIEFAQGHDNAFGFSISKDQMDNFKEYSRNVEKQEVVYEVDVLTDKPSKEDCVTVDTNKYLFGGKVSEPLIGVSKLSVPKKFIKQRGSVLNIYSYGVGMIQFNHNPAIYEEMMEYEGDNVILDIVGTYGINDWGGRKSPQMIIKDIEVVYETEPEQEVTEETIVF